MPFEEAVSETSTLERLDVLKERSHDVVEYGEEIAHAFEFIMLLRIQNQFGQISGGQEPDNLISPDSLTSLQKKTITEAFKLITRLQESIAERYKPPQRILTCQED